MAFYRRVGRKKRRDTQILAQPKGECRKKEEIENDKERM